MSSSTIRSRWVMAGHVRTHYIESGDNGPVLIFCHGGGPGSGGEAGFARLMPMLSQHFQVYAPDSVGGFGETDVTAMATEGVHSRVDHLEDFIDALCLKDIYLTGNSQGAYVALRYALQHPDRVRKLFLIASATISGAMGIGMPPSKGMEALRSYDGTLDSMKVVLQALHHDHSAITPELVKLRNDAANRPGAAQARAAFEEGQRRLTTDPNMRLKFDLRDMLPKLNIPIMLVWGENDTFALPELGHKLAPMLPNIPITFLPNAGHQVQNDQPELIARMMTEFYNAPSDKA